jgi:hypothetical protein
LTTNKLTSDDEEDRGAVSRKNEGFSDDDLFEPEQDKDLYRDGQTLGNKKTVRPGDERVQRKNATNNAVRQVMATCNKERAAKDKAGEETAPRPSMNPYRLQIKFGKVVQDEKRVIIVMDNVSEFMQHWNLIDKGAELTNLHGEHNHWKYKAGKAPRTPCQVRHCVHAFYNKGGESAVVLSTTIKISPKRDSWSTQKQMIRILQGVCVGIFTETSSILRHDRDNICAEIRGLCNIPPTPPLGVH